MFSPEYDALVFGGDESEVAFFLDLLCVEIVEGRVSLTHGVVCLLQLLLGLSDPVQAVGHALFGVFIGCEKRGDLTFPCCRLAGIDLQSLGRPSQGFFQPCRFLLCAFALA